MEFPLARSTEVIGEIRRVAATSWSRGKFPVVLGGEHSITAPIVAALAVRHPGLSVLQIDAHARPARLLHGNTSQPRLRDEARPGARADDAGRDQKPVARGSGGGARPSHEDFLRLNMRQDEQWIDRVVDSLSEDVYITIDCDGLDPAIMPSVGHTRTGRARVVRDVDPAPAGYRITPGRGLRSRRVVPDPGQRRAQLPVREV